MIKIVDDIGIDKAMETSKKPRNIPKWGGYPGCPCPILETLMVG
jgi:hypothetical protein